MSLKASQGPSFGALAAALSILSLLLMLPGYLTPIPASPFAPWSVEVLVLATLLAATAYTARQSTRWVATAVYIGYLLYALYDALVYTAFQRHGILYEDLRFLTNAFYLISEQAEPTMLLTGAVALLALGSLLAMIPRCMQALQHGGTTPAGWALLFGLHLVAWPVVLWHAPAEEWGTEHRAYREVREDDRLRTLTAQIHANLDASRQLRDLLQEMGDAPPDSAYYAYTDLTLTDRPPLYWFIIESYGQVLTTHPDLQAPFARVLRRVEEALAADGWHMATTTGPAPIRGGRSWLAHATLLSGAHIHRQVLDDRFKSHPSYPTLVRTLQHHGYHTIGLQPPNRARPGLPLRDPYQFDTALFYDDLQYEGPSYGWGGIPDQYSLYFTHENILPRDQPFFLFFAMADAHALWRHGLAPYVDHWERFNQAPTDSDGAARRWIRQHTQSTRDGLLPDSLTQRLILNQPPEIRYLRTVTHNWRLIRDYLQADAPDDAVVWVFGDHQPPVLPLEDSDVPIHIFARDPDRLQPFLEQGFTRGLALPDAPDQQWPLEGLYSLTMRALAQYNAQHNDPPNEAAPLRPEGVPYRMLAP
ncbi:MAG: hypothetical protein PPP56_11175 [Longimonas sp.]|uniref:hypothetical protein n=1 Tax=Longimonas sp. TaxID=2039626 RepID=UPI00334AB9F5